MVNAEPTFNGLRSAAVFNNPLGSQAKEKGSIALGAGFTV
jgi:hypothetical protein